MFKKNVEKFLALFVLGMFLAFLAFNSLNIERKNFEDKLTNSRSIHLELTEQDINNALNVLNTGIYILIGFMTMILKRKHLRLMAGYGRNGWERENYLVGTLKVR